MATRKINVLLDESLVRRARQRAIAAIGKSDAEIVEDALSLYLGEQEIATGSPDSDQAERRPPEEVDATAATGL